MKILDFFKRKRSLIRRSLLDLSNRELVEIKREIERRSVATGKPLSDFAVRVTNDGYVITP